MDRNQLRQCAVFGIDIGKNLFHVVGLDSSGARRYCSSSNERTERLSNGIPSGFPMACAKLQTMGHSVRIIPAQ
ncbi:hypothetical protein N1937_28200 (plasmid) [Rhizobium sp. WSM4643]|nr:hypothetical protein [Rhizobium leguminosarum]UWM79169.1 hypothetical protein N1937_28200 [Rhizobium leguminosarum bv. viciae]